MDALLPVLAGLIQLLGVSLVVGEVVAAQRLTAAPLVGLSRWTHPPTGLPAVTEPERLVGMEGRTDAVRWRWDPERRALLFARPLFRPVWGERGMPAGLVRFGPGGAPTVRWYGSPLSLWPLAFGLACLGALYFVAVEGECGGLLVVPAAALGLGLVGLLFQVNARLTLQRLVLPALAERVRLHLDDPGAPADGPQGSA